jgi:dihydroorotate dehydrogenase
MPPSFASALLPVLRLFDAEAAHALALQALQWGLAGRVATPDDPRLAVAALGLAFANPVGLAAGFDKDAVALPALMRLGFGLVEAGTVTPLPQAGNPRPRLFRLERDAAVINRMGFNNAGLVAYVTHLAAARAQARALGVPVGANVGVNKNGAVPERDYPALVAAVAPHADYIVINVSSPNTPGLRSLQAAERLAPILAAVAQAVPHHPPLLVKLAPDLNDAELQDIVAACLQARVAGLVVSNTTTARPPGLRSRNAAQAGGLSGAPLFAPSTAMLARVARLARGQLVLVGVGGVASGRQALAKIRAGATLVQLYTALAIHGPALIPRLKMELLAALEQDGFASVSHAIGADLKE